MLSVRIPSSLGISAEDLRFLSHLESVSRMCDLRVIWGLYHRV